MKVSLVLWMSCFVLISCARIFSLEDFLFEPEKVDEYFRAEDIDAEWGVRFIIPDSLYEEVSLISQENRIYGFFVKGHPDSTNNNQVTILYCHGNARNINRYWGRVEYLWEMGYNVFIFDYQGYGKSEGSSSGDAWFSDGQASLEYLRSRLDVDASKIVYYGWSLGSFVATYLSSDVRHAQALILEAAPASVAALLADGGLVHLPGVYVADCDFNNEERIAGIGCPVFMMHGYADDFIVFERHVPYVWENAVAPKESLWIDGAEHDDIPEVLGQTYYERIRLFIDGYVLN